jgi:hypothetical protein
VREKFHKQIEQFRCRSAARGSGGGREFLTKQIEQLCFSGSAARGSGGGGEFLAEQIEQLSFN